MRHRKQSRATSILGLVPIGLAAVTLANSSAPAQTALKNPNETSAYLIHQDFSDCTNQNVRNGDSPLQRGYISLVRTPDGNTTVKVGITAQALTTYHFFLKCVRLLGDLSTDDEGTATAIFVFPTNSVGSVYAFDMYRDGAPLGNKIQSTQVNFQ